VNTNKLASATGEKTLSFNYDLDGNTTVENNKQFIYNQNQRLIQAVEGSNVLGEYVYNGNGQRVNADRRILKFRHHQSRIYILERTAFGEDREQ
jgi:hypothetical protein